MMYVVVACKLNNYDQWVECVCTEESLAKKIKQSFEDNNTGEYISYSVFPAKIMSEIDLETLSKKS